MFRTLKNLLQVFKTFIYIYHIAYLTFDLICYLAKRKSKLFFFTLQIKFNYFENSMFQTFL